MRAAWKLFSYSFNVHPRVLFWSLTYIGCSKEKLLSDLPGTSAHPCHRCTGSVTWIWLHLLLFMLQSLRGWAADQVGAVRDGSSLAWCLLGQGFDRATTFAPLLCPFGKAGSHPVLPHSSRQAVLPTHLFFTLLMSVRRSLTEVSGCCLLPGRSKWNHHCFQHSGCIPSEGC